MAGAAGCARRHFAIDDILPLADRGAARRRDQCARRRQNTARRCCRSSSSRPKSARSASPRRRRAAARKIPARRRPTSGAAAAPAAGSRRASGGRPGRVPTSETPAAPGTNARSTARHRPASVSPISWNRVARRPFTSCAVTMSEASVLRPIHCREMIEVEFFGVLGHDVGPGARSFGTVRRASPMPGTAP